MALKLLGIFKGDLNKMRISDNRDFLDAEDVDILHLKYIILQSARLAFHFSLESFIMGEMDLPELDPNNPSEEFEVSFARIIIF